MPIKAALIFPAIAILFFACKSTTQKINPVISKIDSLVNNFLDTNKVPGLALAVISDDSVIMLKGYGVSEINKHDTITGESVFHLASVTKTFTGVAVMQLVEAEKIYLNDPVSKFIPEFADRFSNFPAITVYQLLNHSSGLPSASDYNWDSPLYDDKALHNYVLGTRKLKPLFSPGSQWSYSDNGYEILGDIISIISGLSYEEYVKQNILIPLDMLQSDLLMDGIPSEKLVSPHNPDSLGKPMLCAGYPYNREHGPSSTMHSSISDMTKWMQIFLNKGKNEKSKTILTDSTFQLMCRATQNIDLSATPVPGLPAKLQMGLTLFFWKKDNYQMLFHGGDDRGFSTSLLFSPDAHAGVIILCNLRFAPTYVLSGQIMDILLSNKGK